MSAEADKEAILASEHAILLVDGQGVVRSSNAAASRLFAAVGYGLEGRLLATLLAEPCADGAVCRCWREEGVWRLSRGFALDGCAFPVEVMLEKLGLELAQGPLFLLSLRCPAAIRREPLNEHLLRLETAAAQSGDAVLITDRSGVIAYVNPVFERLSGFACAEAVGKTPALIKSGAHSQEFYAKLWQTLHAGREFCGVFVNRHKNGRLFHEEKRLRPFVGLHGDITHFVSTGHDISENVQAHERLEYLANHDSLTSLPNRALFTDRLRREFVYAARYGGGFALCYLDLDQLKPVNDVYGHGAGDALLRTVAEVLTQCVRAEDTVARLGGDEFGLILKGVTHWEQAHKVLSIILSTLRGGALIEGRRTRLSVSIGVCLFPADGGDEASLLAHADKAMYRAKAAGGDGFCFFNPERDCGRPAD